MSDGDYQRPDGNWIPYDSPTNLSGIDKIANERYEQKVIQGRSIKSDYELNSDFQLVDAAIKLLRDSMAPAPTGWDEAIWQKMMKKTEEQKLIIAGALIAAEIDRLNFKS